MAAQVGPLSLLRLPAGPSASNAEQRHWQLFKNQLLIPSPTGYAVTHVAHSPSSAADNAFAVTTGTRVQLYSSRTRKLLRTISRFSEIAHSGCLRPDGRVAAAADDSGLIQVFDASSRAILRSWSAHRQPVWAVRFSPANPTALLSAGDDKTVRLWDLPSSEPVRTLLGHADYVRSAAFMPASFASSAQPLLLSGSYDATVRLWDPRAARPCVMTFRHSAPVEDVLPMPSGTTVIAASGNTISVLDLVAARPLIQVTNHQKTVTCLSLAMAGRRVLAGGLDGHVKVFETANWNVVYTRKYPSPVLALTVVGPSSSPTSSTFLHPSSSSSSPLPRSDEQLASFDRHLIVGMQSGLLSITTRLSAAAIKRDRDRERTMTALVAGDTSALDAKAQKRKRLADSRRRLDMVGEAADVVIAADVRRHVREPRWQRLMRHGHYAAALDLVLSPVPPGHSHVEVLSLLTALRHRSAMRDALEGRHEAALHPIIKWLCSHMIDPRYLSVCIEAALHLHDLYADQVDASADLLDAFRTLHRRVRAEVELAQVARQTGGMLETLLTPHTL